jgi:Domain of unknown function (DUF6883)
MNLPNIEAADVAEAKIKGYLLNPMHPDGESKARFFMALGFSAENWQVFAAALLRLAAVALVTARVESVHGTKYIVDGAIDTPSGKAPVIRTVWIVDRGGDTPRLVTAYPHERGA